MTFERVQLFLPHRRPKDPKEHARNIQELEAYLAAPHPVWGTMLTSPILWADDVTTHAGASIPGDTSSIPLQYAAVVNFPVVRPTKGLIWGITNLENNSAGAYSVDYWLSITGPGNSEGQFVRERLNNDGFRRVVPNMRQFYIGPDSLGDYTFYWWYRKTGAADSTVDIIRQYMAIAMFDASDVDPDEAGTGVSPNVEPRWTRSIDAKKAYWKVAVDDTL